MIRQQKISELFRQKKTKSIEVFPPRTSARLHDLLHIVETLATKSFDYINITSKLQQAFSIDHIVEQILKRCNTIVVPHVLTYGMTKQYVRTMLAMLRDLGITNILVIRGDTRGSENEFESVVDLLRFVKEGFPEYCIGVSCYPEGYSESYEPWQEMEYIRKKIAEGADYLVTQFFFDSEHYHQFVARARKEGIGVPIVPGITIVRDTEHVQHLSKLSRMPLYIPQALQNDLYESQSSFKGLPYSLRLIQDLIAHAPGIHLYTFNTIYPFDKVLDFIAQHQPKNN